MNDNRVDGLAADDGNLDDKVISVDITQIIMEIEDVQQLLTDRINAMNKALHSFDEKGEAELAVIKGQAESKLKRDFMTAMLDLQDEINEISSMSSDDIDPSLKSLADGVQLTHKGALQAAGVERIEDAIVADEESVIETVQAVKPAPKKKRGRRNLGAMMNAAEASFDPFSGLDVIRDRVNRVLDECAEHKGDEIVSKMLESLEGQFKSFDMLSKGQEKKQERLEKDKTNAQLYGAEKLAKKFIEVVDNMDRALQATEQHKDNESVKSLYVGVSNAKTKLVEAFAANGIERDDPMGEKLNPNRHQAVAMLQQEGAEKNEIINVSASGYLIRERVIRPAMVVVAR